MKILMINVVCGIKSTGRICTDLARSLQAQGHEVKIAYGREEVPEEFTPMAVPIGSKWGTYAHGVKALGLDGAGLGSKQATKAFLSWVREFDPDIIHLHNLHGYYIHVPTLFAYLKTANKKVIWTFHDMWPFTGHSPACDQADCEKWLDGCGGCPMKGEYPRSLTDFSRRNWKWKRKAFLGVPNMTLVSPSAWLWGLTGRSFMGEYPMRVIRNGIDVSHFQPTPSGFREKYGLEGKKLILGIAGNWHDTRKGFPDFMKLAARLPENCHIVMVGVPEDLKSQLPSNVLGLGKTNSIQELAEIYSAADVFLNPTYSDNFPTVNLEALCCGTPLLTYHTGGSTETVKEGCGAVAEQGDLDQVLELLPACMAQKAFVTEKAWVFRELYSKEKMVSYYEKLYFA